MGFLIIISEQQPLQSPHYEKPMGDWTREVQEDSVSLCSYSCVLGSDSLQWTSRARDLCRWNSVLMN